MHGRELILRAGAGRRHGSAPLVFVALVVAILAARQMMRHTIRVPVLCCVLCLGTLAVCVSAVTAAAPASTASTDGGATSGTSRANEPFPSFLGLTVPEARLRAEALGMQIGSPSLRVWPGRPGLIGLQLPWQGGVPPVDFDGTVEVAVSTGLRTSGRVGAEFRTTSGAAYCQLDTALGGLALVCWTPKNGRIVSVAAGDIPFPMMRFHRQAIGARSPGFRTVGYGASWVWRAKRWDGKTRVVLSCYSNRKALTCENDVLAGFRLGRDGRYQRWARTEV